METIIRDLIKNQPKVNMKSTSGRVGSLRGEFSERYIAPSYQFPINIDMSVFTVPDVEAHNLRGLKVSVHRWEIIANSDREILDCLRCSCGRHLIYGQAEEESSDEEGEEGEGGEEGGGEEE